MPHWSNSGFSWSSKIPIYVLCFSESRIVEDSNLTLASFLKDIKKPRYACKGKKGVVLIYVKNGITFVPRDGLNMQEGKN